MAQEQTIGFRITLGTDQKVINTVKELRQEFLKVNEELQNTTKGTERYEELQKQAEKSTTTTTEDAIVKQLLQHMAQLQKQITQLKEGN